MFLKVIKKSEHMESLYECERIHTHWSRHRTGEDSDPLLFVLEQGALYAASSQSLKITIKGPEHAEIFIMNNEGKTIEKIEHKPEGTKPELAKS